MKSLDAAKGRVAAGHPSQIGFFLSQNEADNLSMLFDGPQMVARAAPLGAQVPRRSWAGGRRAAVCAMVLVLAIGVQSGLRGFTPWAASPAGSDAAVRSDLDAR